MFMKKHLLFVYCLFLACLTIQAIPQATTTPQHKEQLHNLINQIIALASKSSDRLKSFFSTENKESFSAHVNHIDKDLKMIQSSLLDPIETMIKESSKEDNYKTILEQIKQLIIEIQQSLSTIHKTLNLYKDNKRIMQVIPALKQMQKQLEPKGQQLTIKIQELFNQIISYDPALAPKIDALKNQINKALNSSSRSTELFRGLHHRINCK